MTYSKIVNPKTGRKVSTSGRIGREILKQYLNVFQGYNMEIDEKAFRSCVCTDEHS